MAKPQLENGHTQIANEILDHLAKLYLSPNQWQVVIFIIRKTYGFKKKVDYIANSQIVEGTGLCKAVVSRVLKVLQEENIITRQKKDIGFQKDWEKWQKLAVRSTLDAELAEQSTNKVSSTANQSKQNSQPKLAEQSTKVSSPRITQKKKETLQKKLYKRKYGEFTNVLLTDEEYQRLVEKFGEAGAKSKMENLSLYLASKGDKYKNHYATILSWENRDRKGGQGGAYRGDTTKRTTDEDRRRGLARGG